MLRAFFFTSKLLVREGKKKKYEMIGIVQIQNE